MNKKIIPAIALLAFMVLGCEKKATVLPPRPVSEEVSQIAARYTELLASSSNGWILAYKPEQYDDTVYMQLRFQGVQTMSILSGYRGFHTVQEAVTYDFEGNYVPIIVFPGESVFGELAARFNGSQKFKMTYVENGGYFNLVRSDGYDNEAFRLDPAGAANQAKLDAQVDAVLAQIAHEEEQARLAEETRLKVKAFAEISTDFYFYNLITERFSARIDALDTLAKTISLTYKETPASVPTSATVTYSIYPKGIVISPVISYGSVVVDSIELGEVQEPTLQIVKAGNAGTGTMGYMHEAPYDFTLTTDRGTSITDWVTAPAQQVGLFAYTQNAEDYYSEMVNQHRQVFGTYLEQHGSDVKTDTRLVHQLYFPATSPTNLQISTHRQSASGNLFFLYRFAMEKSEAAASALTITFTEPAGATVPLKAGFDEYFSHVFPEEGVTVVPVIVGTTLRLRLVSVKDSRIWVEYILQTAAHRSLRFD